MYDRLGQARFDIPRRDDAMSAVIRASMNSITNGPVAAEESWTERFDPWARNLK